ncbi:DUF4350 domain-containing protein [Nonomuraea rhizosphaerae]|uniref:DUF4350 domain-containing protein n=1 Tax=Nonomuraea rhizosphaerae TaxID=2665663 RepID=UPI001C5D2D65|nr:DUF4350 domain-containing protein [Nonomuraea rhizosphaerae]
MSLDMRPAPETAGSRSTSPTARSTWRASRGIVVFGLIIVAAAVFTVLIRPDGRESRRLDPADSSLAGSMALAELLRDRGVTVDRVDSAQAAYDKSLDAGDRLLLITDTLFVDERRLADIQGDRIIVGGYSDLDVLAPGLRVQPGQSSRERSRDPGCDLPAAKAAGSVHIGGLVMNGPQGAVGCYPAGEGSSLVSYTEASRTITVVGSSGFMTNQRLAEDGNAALALDLLGSAKAVTWLVAPDEPPVGTLPGEDGESLYGLMPESIPWAVWMSVITVLLVAFWRGRRLGPVVVERLPVVVRAAETVEGRGRLYRSRRARERAADSLRAGTVDRLTPRLGLGSGAGRQELVAAVAVRTGQDAQQVGAALYGPPPADDAALVALAGYLDVIERNVSEH